MNDPFQNLTKLLTEMQLELGRRAWGGDVFDRIEQASDFRGKLFDAIQAYTDYHVGIVKP